MLFHEEPKNTNPYPENRRRRVPRVSSLLRRELAVLGRTLAGRDDENLQSRLAPVPAFVATLRPGPGDDVGAKGSSLGDGGLLHGEVLPEAERRAM